MLVLLNQYVINEGDILMTTQECECEGDIYEQTFYPRKSFVPKPPLMAGTEVRFVKKWSNAYGNFYRVEHDGKLYDLKERQLTKARPEDTIGLT